MGIRSRRARSHSKTHVVGFTIAGFFGFMAMLAVAGALSLSSIVAGWLEDLPDYTSAEAYLVAEPTRIYDCNGTQIAEYYLQQRRSIDLSQVSQYVIDGTVDTEDDRFYTHNGVDPQGILRAVWAQLMGRSEGASTITQQLVRNTVLSSEQFEYSVKRKVREAYIALQMEKMFTKDQILNMYLNTIYYGYGAYGIEAAAVTYFNVHASDLTLSQAALLVGLPQSPSVYDPTINPDLAISRRNIVLDRMLYAGDITQEEFDAASSEELVLNIGSLGYPVGTFPYFTDYVRELLLEDFDEATILQGGLKVYTTIDPDIQRAAERAVVNQLDESWNDSLTGALVCIENGNGYVRAMVGGRSYDNNEFNAATAATRQCGSSFKVYTLVAALRSGMNPNVNLNCTRRSPRPSAPRRSSRPAGSWASTSTSPRISRSPSARSAFRPSRWPRASRSSRPAATIATRAGSRASRTVTATSSTSTPTIPRRSSRTAWPRLRPTSSRASSPATPPATRSVPCGTPTPPSPARPAPPTRRPTCGSSAIPRSTRPRSGAAFSSRARRSTTRATTPTRRTFPSRSSPTS